MKRSDTFQWMIEFANCAQRSQGTVGHQSFQDSKLVAWRLHVTADALSELADKILQSFDTKHVPSGHCRLTLESGLRNLAWALPTENSLFVDQTLVNYLRAIQVDQGATIPEISSLFDGLSELSRTDNLQLVYDLEKTARAFRDSAFEIMARAAEIALLQATPTSSSWANRLSSIVLLVVMVVLSVAVLVPSFVKARVSSSKPSCLANLKQLEGATATWQLENKKPDYAVPTWEEIIGPTLYIRNMPHCPEDGRYTLSSPYSRPTCTRHGSLENFK